RAEFAFASAVSFTVWTAPALYLTLAPTYVATILNLNNLAVGGAIASAMVGTSALTQGLGGSLSLGTAIRAGLVLLSIGLAGVVLSSPLQSLSALLVGTLIVGAGHGLAFMGSLALVNRIAPIGRRAETASNFYVISYFGIAL